MNSGDWKGWKEWKDYSQSPKGSLFSNRVIFQINPIYDIIPYLQVLGYPETSIKSLLRCGEPTGGEYAIEGKEGWNILPQRHHCDKLGCDYCAKRRKRRVINKYSHFILNLQQTRNTFLRFLTISPENYEESYIFEYEQKGEIIILYGLEAAIKHLILCFSEFRKHEEIKNKLLGGLYSIEAAKVYAGHPYYDKRGKIIGFHKKTGLNTHLHAITYDTRLDNQIRGECKDCGQNLMRFDKDSGRYYCGSWKCGSYNVEIKDKNSKIVRLFSKISEREVNIDIRKLDHPSKYLGYMLKYITDYNKNFTSPADLAKFIYASKKKKLVHPFGCFRSVEGVKSSTKIITDYELIRQIKEGQAEHSLPSIWDPQSEFVLEDEN